MFCEGEWSKERALVRYHLWRRVKRSFWMLLYVDLATSQILKLHQISIVPVCVCDFQIILLFRCMMYPVLRKFCCFSSNMVEKCSVLFSLITISCDCSVIDVVSACRSMEIHSTFISLLCRRRYMFNHTPCSFRHLHQFGIPRGRWCVWCLLVAFK